MLVIGLLALAGAVALIGVQVTLEYRDQVVAVDQRLLLRAQTMGAQSANLLRNADEALTRLVAHPTVAAGDAAGCALWIREAASFLPLLSDLQVERPDLGFACSARGWPAPRTPTGAGGEAGDRPGPVGAPTPMVGTGDQVEWVVPLVREIPDGAARAYLGTEYLVDFLASTLASEGEVLTLADSSGLAVARAPNGRDWVGRDLLATGVTAPPPERRGTFRSPGADGLDRVWGYERVEGTPWVLIVGLPQDAVMGPVREAAVRQGLLALLLVSVFGGLLVAVDRMVRGSLARLGEGAARAQRGLGVRVEEDGPSEVMALARILNRTLAARDEAQQDLAGALERHELVLRASRDMIWDWDLQARRLHGNNALRRFLGKAADRMRSPYEWFERIPEPDRTRVRQSLERALAHGSSVWIQEYPMADAAGGRVQVLDRGYVVRGEDGSPSRMVGVMSDVTEARRRSDEVRRSKERYESIVRNAPFAVFLCAEDGELVEWNPALNALLGEPWEDRVPTRRVPDFFAQPAQFISLAREARDHGVVIGREAIWTRADGSEIFVRLTLTTFDEAGEPRLEALAEDVTDRRRLGEQVRHAQKMEAVGRLAGGVAHDFNNLLTVISGESRILLGEPGLDEEARESLEAVLEAGERGTALTRQLLAFSRRQVVDLAPLDMNEVVTRLERMLSRLLGEETTLALELAPRIPAIVADSGELEQILLNLVVNARDAMPTGGLIRIRTREFALGPEALDQHPGLEVGDYVILSVEDEGCGIDHAIVSRIFEPFFTTKAVGKGTGLGLSMVYGMVSRLGGKVEVETEPGSGTIFHLYLPAAREGAAAPTPPRPSSPRSLGGDGRIVVVEDEAAVRRMALRILERAGYEVATFGHPMEALEAFREPAWPAHLLLTDVRMPGMHGNELADRVREFRPGLPVLYMSGYPEEAAIADRIEGQDAGFLSKPFTPEALLGAVRLLLNVNSAARATSPTNLASRTGQERRS